MDVHRENTDVRWVGFHLQNPTWQLLPNSLVWGIVLWPGENVTEKRKFL
jgi:hypothetical protein